MGGLKIALLTLVSNLRSDAQRHDKDVRHPRVVLENRANDAYRIVEMLDKTDTAPVANRERVAEVLMRAIHLLDSNPNQWNELDPIERVAYRDEAESLAIALFTSGGVFRDEATVKAELAELIAVRSQELIGGGPGGVAAAIAREAVTS